MNTIPKSATSILVVNDTLANLQLLAERLQKRGDDRKWTFTSSLAGH